MILRLALALAAFLSFGFAQAQQTRLDTVPSSKTLKVGWAANRSHDFTRRSG